MTSKLPRLLMLACGLALLLALAPRASADPPKVVVIDPDGGETWYETQTIRWSGAVAENENADNITYQVYLSVNGGSSWHFLGENTYEEENYLTAHEITINTVGFDDSSICLVKVVATNENDEENVDTSDNFFTIQNSLPAPSPLSPASGSSIKNQTPTLDWEEVEAPWTVENYVVQVAKDTSFSAAKMVYTTVTEESEAAVEQVLSDDWYYWRVRAVDNRGAVSAWSPTSSFEVFVLAPVVMSFEPEEVYTSSASLGLSLSAVNVQEISFSTNQVDWSPWEPYSQDASYDLPAPDGPKTVYVRGKSVGGRISDTRTASVILDRAPPTTTYSLSGKLGERGYRGSVTVTLSSVDVTTEVNEISYRIDGGEWKDGATFTIAEEGSHEVEYRATDLAGNTESIKSFTVDVYTPVTPFPYMLIFASTIGAIVIGILTWRKGLPKIRAWRKQRQLRSKWFRELVGWEAEKRKRPAKSETVEAFKRLLTPAAERKARKRKKARGKRKAKGSRKGRKKKPRKLKSRKRKR